MDDVDRYAGPLADLDRFLNRLEDAGSFVADVRGIDSARARHFLTQFHDVVGGRQRSRRHRQHARQSPGPFAERLANEFAHLEFLFGAWLVEGVSHHALPHAPHADISRDVDRDPFPFE